MKASLELADTRRGFQPDAWQVRPTEAFQRSGFQETGWQEDPHSGAFQDTAFQDEAFQVTDDAFQEFAWQGTAFQIELEPAPAGVVQPPLKPVTRSRQRSDRFARIRQHRQARIVKAPQPAVGVPQKASGVVHEDRRAAFVRTRRRRPITVRARIVDQRPRLPVQEVVSRARFVRRRTRKPILVRAKLVAATPRLPIQERTSRSRLIRRRVRKPILTRAILVSATPRQPIQERASRSRFVRRRARKPIILRATYLGSVPLNGIPVKRVFVAVDRRAAYVRAKVRRKQIVKAVSVPTPVPWIRNHIVVNHRARQIIVARARRKLRFAQAPNAATPRPKIVVSHRNRNLLIARARRKVKIVRNVPAAVVATPWVRNHVHINRRNRAATMVRLRQRKPFVKRALTIAARPPAAIVHQQRRRLQRKRNRTIVLRSVPLWQRPRTPVIVGQHRKAGIIARARHRLRLIVSKVYGPPPPPATESGFGLVFLSDVPVYDTTLADLVLYDTAITDTALFPVSVDDLPLGDVATGGRPAYEVALDDIPGA